MFKNLPSVCFGNENEKKIFAEKNVFQDLFGKHIFSEPVFSILGYKINTDEINERRRIFSDYLSSEKSFDLLGKIKEKSDYIRKLRSEIENCENQYRGEYLFFLMFKGYTDFLSLIRGSDFISYFESLKNEICNIFDLSEYKKFSDEISYLTECYSVNHFDLIFKKGKYSISSVESASSILETIECFLKIEPDLKKDISADEIIGESVKNNGDYTKLSEFAEKHRSLDLSTLLRLQNEIDFYFEIIKFARFNKDRNIPYSFPEIIKDKKQISFKNAYDVTLRGMVIPNNVSFNDEKGFYLIRGANGGGKTTYLRAVTINIIFAAQGCPVYCDAGSCFLPDRIFTHFPSDENFYENGRYFNEKERAEKIEKECTADSFAAFNETYSGTNEDKGIKSSVDTIGSVMKKNCFGMFVTHHNIEVPGTVILSPVVEDGRRTFIISAESKSLGGQIDDILTKYNLNSESFDSGFFGEDNK